MGWENACRVIIFYFSALLFSTVVEKRNDNVAKTKFVKLQDRLAYSERT